MNKKLKSLLLSGIISLGMLFGSTVTSDAMTYMYANANVNVRQYNSTTSKKVGYVTKGTKVATYNTSNGWKSVRLANGTWGYIKATYLSSKNTSGQVSKGQVLKKLVIVNSYFNKIYLYENGKLVWSRPCATGKSTSLTPVGSFQVINKIVNPYYSKGNIAGGSPKNPLGCRWLGIGGSYGIHGTNNESSIGKKVSNGCVRLHNYDIKDLYNRVPVGTKVIISAKATTNKTIASWYGYKVY